MATNQKSSKRGAQNILIGVLIALAMCGGFYVLCYTPTNKKIESVRREVKKEEAKLATARKQAPLVKPMTEKVKKLETKLVEYRAKIAGKGEVISLIKVIEREAQKLGLTVKNIRTRKEMPLPPADGSSSGGKNAPAQPPAYTKIVLDSSMKADFYKLEDFLSTLQKLKTFIVIESINVATNKNEGSELNLKFKMSLYSNNGINNTFVAKKE